MTWHWKLFRAAAGIALVGAASARGATFGQVTLPDSITHLRDGLLGKKNTLKGE